MALFQQVCLVFFTFRDQLIYKVILILLFAINVKGFEKYLENGDFADIELLTEKGSYKAHRLILIYSSEFFAKLLTSDFLESTQEKIPLRYKDPEGLFPEVLRFMYKGRITIDENNAIPLLALADHYLIHKLRTQASDFICRSITRHNALVVLETALQFNVAEIVEKCIAIIAKNFCHFPQDTDWTFLPLDVFMKLLQQEYLTIKDEYSLYTIICNYIQFHKNLTPEEAKVPPTPFHNNRMHCTCLSILF